MKHDIPSKVNRAAEAILNARSHDPFAYLGLHQNEADWVIRVFAPYHTHVAVHIDEQWQPLQVLPEGMFEWRGIQAPPLPYRLKIEDAHFARETFDPYCFPNPISEHDLYLFGEGRLYQGYRMLGAQPMELLGVQGVSFAVWAPNAERVSVVGDFNRWDARRQRRVAIVHSRPGARLLIQIRNSQPPHRQCVRQNRSLCPSL
jgi:1,4-alpha-glucan branching enzyme